MGKIVARKETGNLFFDFRYLGKRCREQTTLADTPANRKKLQKLLERIEAEITLGTFDYNEYFPSGSQAQVISRLKAGRGDSKVPIFRDFAELWFDEKQMEWRQSHIKTVRLTLEKHLLPNFGKQEVSAITKADILAFRSALGKVPGQKGQSLSATRINHIMTPLRMILNEAADRFEFTSPFLGIKSLKVPKTDVEPFTLQEVLQIVNAVREDFRPYFTVRFFSGMRTAEIDGLQWKYVDFERRQILIRETWVGGKLDYTKNDGSQREIDMSGPVYEALKEQQKRTGNEQFANAVGLEATQVRRYGLLILLLLGAITPVVLYVFQRFLLRPILLCNQALEQLNSEHSAQLPERTLFHELDTICRSVRQYGDMTRQLQHANQELMQLSQQDGLTGLSNRRHFDSVLDGEHARACRHGHRLTLLLIDIDHFKALNDRHGHLLGDDCLRQLAGVLHRFSQRPGDLAARFGGEEFALILPDMELEQSLQLAERVLQAVAELVTPTDTGEAVRFTASAGMIHTSQAVRHTPESMIHQADLALYRAKQLGRNRVEAAGEVIPQA